MDGRTPSRSLPLSLCPFSLPNPLVLPQISAGGTAATAESSGHIPGHPAAAPGSGAGSFQPKIGAED